MQSQTLYLNNRHNDAFSRVTSVVFWPTTPMEPWEETSLHAVRQRPENSVGTGLLIALFSESTSSCGGSTHIWQTDGGREKASPFVNSIPVDSLGRTANTENKHSLWLQMYNCSLPNNSYKKTVVDAVGCWIFFLSFFFLSGGGGGF